MPDEIGRYTLAEMRGYVWRKLDALRPAGVDEVTGTETGEKQIDALYSKEDVNLALNSALTSSFVNLVVNDDTVMADEETVDIKKDVVEYELPTDLCLLRGLFWKSPFDAVTTPVNDRDLMDLADGEVGRATSIPKYRRQLNFFVLDRVPQEDNAAGVLVRYVKHMLWLSDDASIIETEFAKIIQEIVVREAATQLLVDKEKLVPPDAWGVDLAAWRERLTVLARNATMPPFVQMITPYMPRARGR